MSKIVNPEDFDRIVSAEIPNENEQPYLYSLVLKHMIHGPCGIFNPTNVCMQKHGKCRSHYPKPYCPETYHGEDSYPKYKRRNNNKKVKIRGHYLDNGWVIPYNSYLLCKFDCHINVEICSTIKAVKYLYKYVYKGHDRISFSVNSDNAPNDIDEIQQFQSARWISPPEATWRIFGFTLSEIYPSVLPLQLHLEDSQLITYNKSDNLTKVITCEFLTRTMLTEFFKMNATNKKAKTLLYKEFPEHFVWNKQFKIWTERKKQKVIGRIVTANPMEGERYYLRILLNHIRGPTSFADLKNVNHIHVSSFRESALLHGLLEGDNYCDLCLEEASLYKMPFALRRLFATLLIFCSPNNPKELWEKYKSFMCEDFIQDGILLADAEVRALKHINLILEQSGKHINDYHLVCYNVNLEEQELINNAIHEEMSIIVTNDDLASIHNLNEEQKYAFNLILERVFTNNGGMFFIDGPGGTGKTYLYRALLAKIRSKKLIALATASSGVAASILPGGRTAHSRFKIPLQLHNNITCSISKQSALANLLQITKLIIWDEAPMMHRQTIEALDRMLQDVTECNLPFGGKVVVFGGDFRQVLPVVPKGRKKDIINASLKLQQESILVNERIGGRVDAERHGSSTSKKVTCNNTICGRRNRCLELGSCPYMVSYVSGETSSSGVLIEDVLHLKREDKYQELVEAYVTFGCGEVQSGSFLDVAAPNGLFGLEMEKISVPSILSREGFIANSFSMCFGQDGVGRISFGDKGSLDQQETPFNLNPSHPTYNINVTQIRDQLRQELEMDPDLPAVLVMGGGEGMGPVKKTAMALRESLYHKEAAQILSFYFVTCTVSFNLRLDLVQLLRP
ncbi:uncharacterized protein LOC115712693 [Cannabis sativa]|uniref:uncharacterized protein LOC115712693 n=1 Tax=Cannabis sativa TaxID=3483 RepID=UPI0029CA03A1|nr:uncharacterized protein LOC115712693 [Cannabis sativa]